MSPNDKRSHRIFDCAGCLDPDNRAQYRPPEARRAYHCGWMPTDEWTAGPPEVGPAFEGKPYSAMWRDDGDRATSSWRWPVVPCPGYLAGQPFVAEVVTAWQAFEKGNFDAFEPDPDSSVAKAVIEFQNAVEMYRLREIEERTKEVKR